MAVFKCKMCGGDLEIIENATVCECEYCGTKQTVPKLDSEKKLALFTRANNLRLKSEFDKAAGIYESIITEFRDEAEAYWGLVLCKYGIEYVEDVDGSRIPTCHRTLPVSIMNDDDFEQACEYADITAKSVYRSEAKAIDKIQKKILKIAHNEAPYDIFICYKETDDVTGARTEDSLIAQDIYTKLIKDGYRVFFARDTLREVAGSDYEPYIYAALSSAKIMLAIGTKHEYYDAVWVKNEWSRFISMMSDDSSKVLIPCFKDMDAYDMPKKFKNMQALCMDEVTFFGNLSDNIERIIDNNRNKKTKEPIIVGGDTADIKPLLERGFLFLEDKKWQKGDDFFEMVLNKDPKNASAYLGKLLVDIEVSKPENLEDFHTPFDDNDNYQKIMRFAEKNLKENIKKQNDIIIRRNEENRKRDIYEKAVSMMANDLNAKTLEAAGYLFLEIKDFNDAKDLAEDCFEKAEVASKNATLLEAKQKIKEDNTVSLITAKELLEDISDWEDADEQLEFCKTRIEELRLKEIEEKREQERIAEQERRLAEEKAKKNRKLAIIGSSVVACVLVFVIVFNTVIMPAVKYNQLVEEYCTIETDVTKYSSARDCFLALQKLSVEYSDLMGDIRSDTKFYNKEYMEYQEPLLAQLDENYKTVANEIINNCLETFEYPTQTIINTFGEHGGLISSVGERWSEKDYGYAFSAYMTFFSKTYVEDCTYYIVNVLYPETFSKGVRERLLHVGVNAWGSAGSDLMNEMLTYIDSMPEGRTPFMDDIEIAKEQLRQKNCETGKGYY